MLVKIQKYKADNIYPLLVKLYTTQNVGYTHETYSTLYIPEPRKLASRHVNMRGGKWNERSLALWRAWQHFDEWSGVLAGPAISVVIRYLICVRVAQQYPLTLWLRRVALRSFLQSVGLDISCWVHLWYRVEAYKRMVISVFWCSKFVLLPK